MMRESSGENGRKGRQVAEEEIENGGEMNMGFTKVKECINMSE